ncbi:MAG: hypothetical protein DRJ32_05970, partial [Thermoprotei archaeon]
MKSRTYYLGLLLLLALVSTVISSIPLVLGRPFPPVKWYRLLNIGGVDTIGEDLDYYNGYIYVVGHTDDVKAVVAKYDFNGRLIWNITLDSAKAYAVDVYEDYIYVAGFKKEGVELDLFVVKLDLDGNQVWNATFDYGVNEKLHGIVVGDYVYVTGYYYTGSSLALVTLKLNKSDGGLIEDSIFDKAGDEVGKDIVLYGDYIYATGYTTSYGSGGKDVVLIKYNLSLDIEWNVTWGTASNDEGFGTDADELGIYVTGISAGDGLVLFFDHDGSNIWSMTWHGTLLDAFTDLDIIDGNIYLAGYTTSYGLGEADILISRYVRSGYQMFNRTFGGNLADAGHGIVVADNSLFIVGDTSSFGVSSKNLILVRVELPKSTYSTSVFDIVSTDNAIYVAGVKSADVFIAKYDMNLNQVWNKSWGGTLSDYAFGIAVNGSSIYVTGYTTSATTSSDIILLKYSDDGSLEWERIVGYTFYDKGYDVAVNGSYVYIVGYVSESTTDKDVFLAKYNASGYQVWNVTWGGSDEDIGYGVAVNGSYIYVVGKTESYAADGSDLLFMKFDADGNLLYNTTWNYGSSDCGNKIAVFGDYVYATGSIYRLGEYDLILLKFDSEGNIVKEVIWSKKGDEAGQDIKIGRNGLVYVAGYLTSGLTHTSDVLVQVYNLNCDLIYWLAYPMSADMDEARSITIIDHDTIALAGPYDFSILLMDLPVFAGETFYTFIDDENNLNATVVIGSSGGHGPCGGANAIDTVGGMYLVSAYASHSITGETYFYLDTTIAWYNESEYKVYYYGVPGLTNIITVAGPGVNQISWKYFCNPWYAP